MTENNTGRNWTVVTKTRPVAFGADDALRTQVLRAPDGTPKLSIESLPPAVTEDGTITYVSPRYNRRTIWFTLTDVAALAPGLRKLAAELNQLADSLPEMETAAPERG